MLPFNLDPGIMLVVFALVLMLSGLHPSPPQPSPVVVIQAPQPDTTAGSVLIGMIIFVLLVIFLSGAPL